jgi:hypothetical protein
LKEQEEKIANELERRKNEKLREEKMIQVIIAYSVSNNNNFNEI